MNVQYETAKTYLRRVREKYGKVGPADELARRSHPARRGRRLPHLSARATHRP